MSLPRRNRRNASVREQHFHWVQGGRGDNGRGVIIVQHATGAGARLMIDPYGLITDDEIPGAIEFALDHGWNPTSSGSPFWIGYSNRYIEGRQFVCRSSSDPPYWTEFATTQ